MNLPSGIGVDYFIDSILESKFGNKSLLEMIDEYEENKGVKLVDAQGADQEALKKKFEKYGYLYWNKENKNAKIDKVLLDVPPEIYRQMFGNSGSLNWLVFLQSGEYDKKGNPVMEKVTEFDDMGRKVQVERPKKNIWRIEYDISDRWGNASKLCDDNTTQVMWDKMLEGLVERMKAGGMAEGIAAAHKANMEKNPAFKTIGAKVGNKIYKQTDPDGNESLCFDIVAVDEYTPSLGGTQKNKQDDFAPSLEGKGNKQDDFAPSL